MQRSSLVRIALALGLSSLAVGGIGCADEGIGDPCIPEAIPCNANGEDCGYVASEAYIEASSVQCRSRLCLVYKLDNATGGMVKSDPRNLCDSDDPAEGCITQQNLLNSVYCTCRCDAPDVQAGQELCKCGDGFTCEPILNLGGKGIQGSYCVRASTVND